MFFFFLLRLVSVEHDSDRTSDIADPMIKYRRRKGRFDGDVYGLATAREKLHFTADAFAGFCKSIDRATIYFSRNRRTYHRECKMCAEV